MKTKQFCETSFKSGKLSAELTASYQCVLRFFPLRLSKVLRLPRKSDAMSYEVLHLSCKIIFPKLKIWCAKMQLLRKSAPGPPNSSDEHVSCTAPAMRNASCHILCTCPTPAILFGNATKTLTFCSLLTRCTIPCACHAERHLNVQKCSIPVSFLHFWLRNMLRATTACTFSTSQLPKVVRTTSKCAVRHNCVHFFDISTSKSGPNVFLFCFYLPICFAPQRRAIFHLSSGQMAPHPPL